MKLKKIILNKERLLQIVSILLVIIISITIFLIKDKLIAFSHYGYIGIFIISVICSASIILPVPGLLLMISFGAVLNPVLVGIIAGIGSTFGELTGYMLGYGGRIAIDKNKKYCLMIKWMKKWGGLTIFILALIPNPLFDLAGIVSGALKYPVWKFLIIGAFGRIPKHILFSYFGAVGSNLFQ